MANNTHEEPEFLGERSAGRLAEFDGRTWTILEENPFIEVSGKQNPPPRVPRRLLSAGSVGRNLGTGIGRAATGWILMASGYLPRVAQSAEALLGIRLLMGGFPAGVALAVLALFRLYPVDRALLGRIERELAEQRREATAS